VTNETLEKVVHAKKNLFHLDCSQNQHAQEVLNSSFEDVLEFVDSLIDEELIQALISDIEGELDAEFSHVNDVDASGSDFGDAGDL
jgi:hypothetical protein